MPLDACYSQMALARTTAASSSGNYLETQDQRARESPSAILAASRRVPMLPLGAERVSRRRSIDLIRS